MFVNRRKRRRRKSQSEGELRPASQFFSGVFKKRGVKTELRAHRLIMAWTEIVGPKIAAHCVPDGLDKGILWVRVETSPWMHQLSFLTADILKKANEKLGPPFIITDIKFHLGRRRRTSPSDPLSAAHLVRRHAGKERALPSPAQGQKLEQICKETSAISDEELRSIIEDTRRRLNL